METVTESKSKSKKNQKTSVKAKGVEKMPKKTSAKPAMKAEKPSKPAGKVVTERIKADIKPSQELKKTEVKAIAAVKEKKLPLADKIKDKPKKDASASVKSVKSSAKATRITNGLVDTASPENKKKWRELQEKFIKEKAPVYSMSGQYEVNQPIEHKVLGWGYILSNMNDRIEVLFETGTKILISNYKSA